MGSHGKELAQVLIVRNLIGFSLRLTYSTTFSHRFDLFLLFCQAITLLGLRKFKLRY